MSGAPTHSTSPTTGWNSASGSQTSHSRNGSAIFAAAKKTNARTTQLNTVPSQNAFTPRSTTAARPPYRTSVSSASVTTPARRHPGASRKPITRNASA